MSAQHTVRPHYQTVFLKKYSSSGTHNRYPISRPHNCEGEIRGISCEFKKNLTCAPSFIVAVLHSIIHVILFHILTRPNSIYWQAQTHEGVTTWKHLPHYWPFLQGIHLTLVVYLYSGNNASLLLALGWVGLWGFLWWAPSAKRKDHHEVSSGWSSVWHRSNTGLSSTQYEQIPIILGFGHFGWLPSFFG